MPPTMGLVMLLTDGNFARPSWSGGGEENPSWSLDGAVPAARITTSNTAVQAKRCKEDVHGDVGIGAIRLG